MSLFRSRLFRWLAQSWPVQWGRQARQYLQRPIRQLETWITAHLQPAIAPVWEATLHQLLPDGGESPPPLLWLEGVPAEPPPAPKSPRRLVAGVPLRLIRVGRASWQRLRAGALAPPTTTLDRRIPRKSFAEILAEAIAYYFGRAKPSLPPETGLPVAPPPDIPTAVREPMPAASMGALEAPLAAPTLETRAVFLGYAYGPLVEFLLWLDRWVERIENFCLRIWRWLRRA